METDFLNFHDEEHFSSGLYHSELLDDSQSSILDIVSDNYSRQNSDYNNSVIWDQEVEREMNGDVAVIPMSGSINAFPKLSNSPPTKDIQKILFCEWQEHLTSIEASDEDLSVDLQLNSQNLVYEMLEGISPENTSDVLMIDSSQIKLPNAIRTDSEPVTTILESNQKFKQKHKPKLKHGGKNLELLKETIKCEPFEDKTEVEEDEFEDVDNFDITKYLIGQDFKKDEDFIIKKDESLKLITEDLEEDHVDIETVSEPSEMPVLEARDLTSLLEQFEASEAVNPKDKKTKYGKIEVKQELDTTNFEVINEKFEVTTNFNEVKKEFNTNDYLHQIKDLQTNVNKTDVGKKDNDKNKNGFDNRKIIHKNDLKKEFDVRNVEDNKNKEFEVNVDKKDKNFEVKKEAEPKKSTPNKISAELIEKMKASNQKKSISVIPAMPKKSRGRSVQQEPKQSKISTNESIQFDHDYCTVLPKTPRRNDDDNKKQIDDTALRIEKRYKSEINKQKSDILKYQPTVKNANGQLMVSLLKMNRNVNNTVVNTTNTNDETVKNIIVNEPSTKKRKLNLEEYLQRKGGSIMKSNDNSRANSPNSGACSPSHDQKSADEKYRNHQELMMKMASEILKTPAKSSKPGFTTKLEEFIPPEVQKKKPQLVEIQKTIKPIEEYEVVTYVSIGVNTDVTKIEEKNNEDDTEVDKLTEIIQPILQKASVKINSNSLITNISATLLQKSPNYDSNPKVQNVNTEVEHGEDKVVQVFEKNRKLPERVSVSVQTDEEVIEVKNKPARQYRRSVSSSSSSSSVSNKNGRTSRRESHRTSSSNSLSSSMGSRWSRSRSRSHSVYSQSSYYSSSSRSRSRSRSPSLSPSRRWHTNRNSRSRHRYSRTRRRSRSNSNGYRNYRRSRSPYSRSHSRKRREQEMEKLKEVEERRVIYVGKISDGTTKADLRRRFQSFGPITNVSVHFREHGDNYGFVTFAYKIDAYEAVEHGNDDPLVPKYDISFGGRRAFCKTRYSDLDNIEAEALNPTIYRKDEDSFDILLREVQQKLRKRKV